MSRPKNPHPTARELEILELLWERGPRSLTDVCEGLRAARPVATTTVSTLLKLMHDKGLVRRAPGARGSLWSARRTRRTTLREIVGGLVDRAFDGSAGRLVAHVIEAGELSAEERDEIRRLLDEAENDGAGGKQEARR